VLFVVIVFYDPCRQRPPKDFQVLPKALQSCESPSCVPGPLAVVADRPGGKIKIGG